MNKMFKSFQDYPPTYRALVDYSPTPDSSGYKKDINTVSQKWDKLQLEQLV